MRGCAPTPHPQPLSRKGRRTLAGVVGKSSPWQPTSSENCAQHIVALAQDFMVPESRDSKALLTEPLIPPRVMETFAVLRTVAFDDESMLEANEVRNVGANGDLTTPFGRLQPAVSQDPPQRLLRICLSGPQCTSARLGPRGERTMMRHHFSISSSRPASRLCACR